MHFVCRFSYYVLRNRMPFVCSEYVEHCSFVRTVSRLCRYTIGYVIFLEYVKVSCIYVLTQTFRHLSPYAIKVLVYITQLISLQRLLALLRGVCPVKIQTASSPQFQWVNIIMIYLFFFFCSIFPSIILSLSGTVMSQRVLILHQMSRLVGRIIKLHHTS